MRGTLSMLYKPKHSLPTTVAGLKFEHPFGMAAGMDKTAKALRGWDALGLGFVEIGGITMLGQDGNPKPRMFRDHRHRALVNRMGFNNPGCDVMEAVLAAHQSKYGKSKTPLFANLGKSKLTPLDEAPNDYATSLKKMWPYVDAFVINVSSPNTPNLRELQKDEALAELLEVAISTEKTTANIKGKQSKPVFVKIAPDVDDAQLSTIVKTARTAGCAGIVVSNTTISRPETNNKGSKKVFDQTGGLSGEPVKNRSTELIRQVYEQTDGQWPIIGVGGIMNAEDAWEKICAGACLIQAYSGFVFEGPALTKNIVHGLRKKLIDSGFDSIDAAVGSYHRNE